MPSSPNTSASSGSMASTPTRCSPRGARAAPATRWWMRRCTRSTRPATCTTGCAWWWPASWSRIWASTGGGAKPISPKQLNDFDLAANNGGWQWAASTGCDAQPYFRIFNPVTQSEKFDAEGKFIRRYLPQLAMLPDKLIHAPWLAQADRPGGGQGRTRRELSRTGGRCTAKRASARCSAIRWSSGSRAIVRRDIKRLRGRVAGPRSAQGRPSAGVGLFSAAAPARSADQRQQFLFGVWLAEVVVHAEFGARSRGAFARCAR